MWALALGKARGDERRQSQERFVAFESPKLPGTLAARRLFITATFELRATWTEIDGIKVNSLVFRI